MQSIAAHIDMKKTPLIMLFFGKFTYIINIRHIKKLLLAVMLMTFSVQGMRGQISTEQAITIGKNVWYFEDYVLSIW